MTVVPWHPLSRTGRGLDRQIGAGTAGYQRIRRPDRRPVGVVVVAVPEHQDAEVTRGDEGAGHGETAVARAMESRRARRNYGEEHPVWLQLF